MSKREALYTASNLCKLADYIEQNVAQDQLDMNHFRFDDNNDGVYFYSFDNCGTGGCALGWSPFHPDMPHKMWMFEDGSLCFIEYRKHYFPALDDSRLYAMAFGVSRSSDKPSVIGRLREVAAELQERAA